MSNNQLITIKQYSGEPIEYKGERVITLSMMDDLHKRPPGTAGRNFRKHRGKFLEGRHFFEVPIDEFRRLLQSDQAGGKDAILLTERGYLKLVKAFRDDLSWDVQEYLTEHYFRSIDRLPSGHLLGLEANSQHLIGLEVAKGIRIGLQEGLQPIREEFNAVRHEMHSGFNEINQRIDRLEKRRNPTSATKRQLIDTTMHFYAGRCNCCELTVVVEDYVKLPCGHWEHWEGPSKNRPHEMWITCGECNLRLRDDFAFKQKSKPRFDSFQQRREQKHLPLLTSFM